MTFDEFLELARSEPKRRVERTVVALPEGLNLEVPSGGMMIADVLADPRRKRVTRILQYGHIIGPPVDQSTVDAWRGRFPGISLPPDVTQLLGRANGIHLWADLSSGRAYEGLAPLDEWQLARHTMYGAEADPHLLADKFIAVSYHTDQSAFVVLDGENGGIYLMDTAGPDLTSPIGSTADDLLDYLWRTRIDPGR